MGAAVANQHTDGNCDYYGSDIVHGTISEKESRFLLGNRLFCLL